MTIDWIGVDWGTSNLRAWAFDGTGRPLGPARGGPGMGGLAGQGAEAFETALVAALGDWLDGVAEGVRLPVLVCGMAGARQGWQEAPYLDLPLPLDWLGAGALEVGTRDPRIAVAIVPGLAQRDPAAPDVLRGEETQILGFLAGRGAGAGQGAGMGAGMGDWALCLPGTHSKWVSVSRGILRSFRTYMTGELFGLLAGQSILRHSVGGAGATDPEAFAVGVREALAAPAEVPARLFGLRARHLLFGEAGAAARSRLSGLLIGQELASAATWPGGPAPSAGVAVIGDDSLAALYVEALGIAGCTPETVSGGTAVIAGLAALRRGRTEEGPKCAN
ncbi:2-keto-3-deoxygalactonate kinase [Tistlia consotensis]|uniref:2-keto-3-deoxygalactonate kinase n=1 Tax=Tistlia consotensis USBA 355 TaxID=560819 RepID=A0A1Y6BPB4_9PROT|nr:2-dehydro-3-deoxygalactonokinase [Tistlia consotensis]SMF13161.1 2-keto-3-deoxygalactonate kinase [Tistlia consotensis USBA 355]SNR50682.1 2-keto-3-deoxygalactonate kinase [Tistlia consotensis]